MSREHDGCKGCLHELEPSTSEYCIGCTQNAVDKYKPMKNSDKVRRMSDEELIEFINYPCKFIKAETYPNRNCVFNCDECIEKWLKEEAK